MHFCFVQGPNPSHGNGNANNSENSKKEEFRRYLEKSGVMDALTKVLVGLYEEPDRLHINALDYVKKYLGAPSGIDLDGLKRENEALKKQVEKYKKQLSELQPEATKIQKGSTG
jgi:hypothetical protein